MSTAQRWLVAADLLTVAGLLWLGLAVTGAFMGSGRFHPYSFGAYAKAALMFGGMPLGIVLLVIAAARGLVATGHGTVATAILALPVGLAVIWLLVFAR